jgi:hypothetical protein
MCSGQLNSPSTCKKAAFAKKLMKMVGLWTKKLWCKVAVKITRTAMSKVIQIWVSPNLTDTDCQSTLINHANQNGGPKATYLQKIKAHNPH